MCAGFQEEVEMYSNHNEENGLAPMYVARLKSAVAFTLLVENLITSITQLKMLKTVGLLITSRSIHTYSSHLTGLEVGCMFHILHTTRNVDNIEVVCIVVHNMHPTLHMHVKCQGHKYSDNVDTCKQLLQQLRTSSGTR